MIDQIEQWIDQTNSKYLTQRICCDRFTQEFDGFYSPSFLQKAFFVVVDTIPKPDFPKLREMGLGDILDMELSGITYKNMYYILSHASKDIGLHFHELVHVAQWELLGATSFIGRYMVEIQKNGYYHAPIELMAYSLDRHFTSGGNKFDIPSFVTQKI